MAALTGRRAALAAAALLLAGAAQAQFEAPPKPRPLAAPPASKAADEDAYKRDAARHLYRRYPRAVYKGLLPPFIYSIVVLATEIDDAGHVRSVTVLRPPAADEVAPWAEALVRAAAPYPAPKRLPGGARWVEIFLVDESGRFQVDTLTEGQR